MKRNLKALGLVLVAVFAMSALTASGAQAVETFKSDSANGKTSITGTNHEGVDKFKAGAVVECKKTHVEGTAPTNSSEIITLTAKYSECTFGGAAASVRMNHCAYKFKANTVQTEPPTGPKHGPVEVECSGVNSFIEVEAAGFCTIFIGAQAAIGDGIVYTNVKTPNGKEELTTHVTATGIVIDHNNGGPFCFLTTKTGEYTGTQTIKGFEDTGSPAEAGTNSTTPTTVKEGGQVNISKS